MTITLLILYSLAVYRLAILLGEDAGPYRFFSRFRSFLKREEKHNKALRKSDVAKGMECLRCNSIWVAAPVAVYAFYHGQLSEWITATGDIFLICMALSSAAILWQRAFPKG